MGGGCIPQSIHVKTNPDDADNFEVRVVGGTFFGNILHPGPATAGLTQAGTEVRMARSPILPPCRAFRLQKLWKLLGILERYLRLVLATEMPHYSQGPVRESVCLLGLPGKSKE